MRKFNDLNRSFQTISSTDSRRKLDLKCSQMEHILVDFKRSIAEGDMVLFYFTAHRIQFKVKTKKYY